MINEQRRFTGKIERLGFYWRRSVGILILRKQFSST
jgi:hypothetical protein